MNVEVAIEEVPGVTCAEPPDAICVLAFREHESGCLRVRPITLHVLAALNPNFANFPIWKIGQRFFIDNPDFDIAPCFPGRSQKMRVLPAGVMVRGWQSGYPARCFSEAIGLNEVTTHQVHCTNKCLFTNGRGPVDDRANRREVSLFRVGNRLDELQDGGHQQNICDALSVDEPKNFDRINVAKNHIRAAKEECTDTPSASGDMKQRHRYKVHRVAIERPLNSRVGEHAEQISVRDLNALGKPGSARCVQLVTGVFWSDIDARELRLE